MPDSPRRRAKIACTLGPSTASPETVRALVEAGMDLARLNLAHGTREEHRATYQRVRQASEAAGRAVAVLADLQGPKIRLGTFQGGSAVLEAGREFRITTTPLLGTAARASTSYEALARDVKSGDSVLIDDGLVRLEVISSDGREVTCRVIEGGTVADHKGLNLPGVAVSTPALTQKDVEDLRFALALGVDLVALSFVRRPEDAALVREVMDGAGIRLPVIAKIEKPEAVARLEAIIEAFDGLIVARGDLGVEMPLEQVPLVQKRVLMLARERGKPAMVATQMLDSMIHHARPTRAEASDVANAALDGADALLLSGETSVGRYPLEAVSTMARLIAAAEEQGLPDMRRLASRPATAQEAIARAAVGVAHDLSAVALAAFTQSGSTARRLASHREPIPLFAFTPDPAVRRQLAVVWGVETFVVPTVADTDALIAQVDRAMLELGRGKLGDRVVIVAGTPPGTTGTTNMLRVHRLGAA